MRTLKIIRKQWRKLRRYQVHIDADSDRYSISGWARDQWVPGKRLELEILVDDQVVATVEAAQYREDMKRIVGGDGKHGFSVDLDLDEVPVEVGRIRLREKSRQRLLRSNTVFVGEGPSWARRIRKKYLEPLAESMEVQRALERMERGEYHYLRREAEGRIAEGKSIPKGIPETLLTIYLAQGDRMEALSFYRRMKGRGLMSLILLEYAAGLWKRPVEEYRSAWKTRDLEIVLTVIAVDAGEASGTVGVSAKEFQNLLAHMVFYGMLADETGLQKIRGLLLEANEQAENASRFYLKLLERLPRLNSSLYRGDREFFAESSHFLSLLETAEGMDELRKAALWLFLNYLEVLVNIGSLGNEDAVSLLELGQRKIAPLLHDKKRLNRYRMEWLRLKGETEESLKLFRSFLETEPQYLDWKSRYFADLLWSEFLRRGEETDLSKALELLYRKAQEDRCDVSESLILLSEMLKWKENASLLQVDGIVRKLVSALPGIDDPIKLSMAGRLIEEWTQERGSDYLGRAREIGRALSLKQKLRPSSRLFGTTRAADLDLYTLSLLSPAERLDVLKGPDGKRYAGLVEGTASAPFAPAEPQQIFLLGEPAPYMVEYYRSLLDRLDGSEITVCWPEGDGFHLCFRTSDTRVREEWKKEIEIPKEGGVVWILSGEHFLHHGSFVTQDWGSVEAFGEEVHRGSRSFRLDASFWRRRWDVVVRLSMPAEVHRELLQSVRNEERLVDREERTGLLSFGNLEERAGNRLADFDRSVFDADELPKALRYLRELYDDRRIAMPTGINVAGVVMVRIKEAAQPLDEEELACFLVQRNEYLRLQGFFDYYRQLGIRRFYVIDNASDDEKTLDFLLDQPDVELYSTPQAYSQSLYGVRWAELLIKAKRLGKWNLVLDADEILILDSKYRDLPELCKDLETEGYDALYTPFVDMYSVEAINRTPYRPGKEILEHCAYHDRHFHATWTPYGGILGWTPTYQGGVRSRIFGLDRVVLNKLPLFRYHPGMRLREGLHWIDRARMKMGEGVLLHFKYIETFHEYVEREIARGQHWNGASEYRKYHRMLRRDPNFSLYDPVLSSRFRGVESFFETMSSPYPTTKEEA